MKKPMKFVLQIRVAMGILLLLMIVFGAIGGMAIDSVAERKDQLYNSYVNGQDAVLDAFSSFKQAVSDVEIAMLTSDEAEREEHFSSVTEKFADMQASIETAEAAFEDEEILGLLSQIKTELMNAKESMADKVEDFQKASAEELENDFEHEEGVQESVEGIMESLTSMIQEKQAAATEKSERYRFFSKVFLLDRKSVV